MKAGDLVMLCPHDYAEYKGKHGVLVEKIIGGVPYSGHRWRVFICGRIHPFAVYDYSLTVIK